MGSGSALDSLWLYGGFILLILVFLLVDLGVFHRKARAIAMKEALGLTAIWVLAACLFNVGVYYGYEHQFLGLGQAVPQLDGTVRDVDGWEAAKLFFAGYLVEKSLAMDNVFVIALLFRYFAVPGVYQHRVLYWGILGAIVMRGSMIAVGAVLIQSFSWIIYVFGGFLVITALKMAFFSNETIEPEKNFFVRLVRKAIPISTSLDEERFFTLENGIRKATPLLLVLVMIEVTDLIFAVDSIPAIFALTADPFIVFTSNIFAILGLRSLYFCLANMIDTFRYLKPALVTILLFVGIKMLLVHTAWKISTTVSLSVIAGVLALGVIASLVHSAADAETSPNS